MEKLKYLSKCSSLSKKLATSPLHPAFNTAQSIDSTFRRKFSALNRIVGDSTVRFEKTIGNQKALAPNKDHRMPLIMLNQCAGAAQESIHSANIEEVHEIPLHVIRRPIPSELDEAKVQSIMETLQVIQTPQTLYPSPPSAVAGQ